MKESSRLTSLRVNQVRLQKGGNAPLTLLDNAAGLVQFPCSQNKTDFR